ncbi:MAG: hypothetical protein ABIO67_05875 [Mycobacteriales bacterium]
MKLDDLDDDLVPRVAARLRAFLDGLSAQRDALASRLRGLGDGPLRRLDDRYASTGPLALMRDVPQLGVLVIAAVFVSGAGIALARSSDQQRAQRVQEQLDTASPTSLGAPVGTDISTYIAQSTSQLVSLAKTKPDTEYTALVSFRAYLTPERVRITLGDLDVQQVVVRAKLPAEAAPAEVVPIPITNLVMDVRTFGKALAVRKQTEAKEFSGLATSIVGTSPAEKQFKAFYQEAAKAALQEARVFAGPCACVIGALVRGKARDLAELPAVATVRAVEVGGRTAADGIDLAPLLPEQTGVVATPAMPGDRK